MEIFQSVLYGFQVALQPINLIHCFLGVLVGTLVGVLPGLGPAAAIALLLPATFKIAPVSATIMLAGIYYGAMYGGSTTSILVNIPGEAASVVTCLDGYQMARRGRAGPALGIAAFASALNVKVGTFDISSTAGASVQLQVTGVGFQPKIVILFWSGTTLTAAGAQGEDISFGWGAFVSGSSRLSVGGSANDAAATTASGRFHHNLRAVTFSANGTTTEAGGLDGYSMDADGFTMQYDVAFSLSIKCHYIALGGDDLTNYSLGTKGMPAATGNYSVTGPGFQADALLVFCASVNAAANQASDAIWMMGFTDGELSDSLPRFATPPLPGD